MGGTKDTTKAKGDSNDDDDNMGGFGGMFGEEEEEQEDEDPIKPRNDNTEPLAHSECPLKDPRGALVSVKWNGDSEPVWYGAKIVKFDSSSSTYTISWLSTGVLQYRTMPDDISWKPPADEEIRLAQLQQQQQAPKQVEDELWLAARRGSLKSVKKFIDSGVDFNETGKDQERTPFYHSVLCGHLECVEYFLSLGAFDPDGTAFVAATKPEIRAALQQAGLTKSGINKKEDPFEGLSIKDIAGLKSIEERLAAVEYKLVQEKDFVAVKPRGMSVKQSEARKKSIVAAQKKSLAEDEKKVDNEAKAIVSVSATRRKPFRRLLGFLSFFIPGKRRVKKISKKT